MLGLFGELGQVFGDAQAGHAGGDVLERSAVGVAGLGIERVDLAGAAAHPQKDAGAAAGRIGGRLGGERLEPAGVGPADNAQRSQSQPIAPRKSARTVSSDVRIRVAWVTSFFLLPRVLNEPERLTDQHELGAVEQCPADIGQRRGLVVLGPARFDIFDELAATRPRWVGG